MEMECIRPELNCTWRQRSFINEPKKKLSISSNRSTVLSNMMIMMTRPQCFGAQCNAYFHSPSSFRFSQWVKVELTVRPRRKNRHMRSIRYYDDDDDDYDYHDKMPNSFELHCCCHHDHHHNLCEIQLKLNLNDQSY